MNTPMLVEHATVLPDGDDWEYEYTWAGERVLAAKDGEGVRMASVLHRREFTNRFPVVAAALAKLNATSVVMDGVVGSIEPAALAQFGLEGEGWAGAPMRIALVASDLLWLDGFDVRQLPLRERRERLRQLIHGSAILGAAAPEVPVSEMIAHARQLGAEAVIAKRRGSKYRPFGRTGDWVRVAVEPASVVARADPRVGGTAAGVGLRTSGAFGIGQMA